MIETEINVVSSDFFFWSGRVMCFLQLHEGLCQTRAQHVNF